MARSNAAAQRRANAKAHARSSNGRSSTPSYSSASKDNGSANSAQNKYQDASFSAQMNVPLYILLTIGVMHAISGSAALHSLHLLPHTLQNSLQHILPHWITSPLPQLTPYDADVPNASEQSASAGRILSNLVGVGPFKSNAAGFGHPLTALHWFTSACLGLSYELPSSPSDKLQEGVRRTVGGSATGNTPFSWLLEPLNKSYSKGPADILLALTAAVAWTAIRALVINYVLLPLGERWVVRQRSSGGASRKAAGDGSQGQSKAERVRAENKATEKAVMRFAEQAWCVCFWLPSLSVGLWTASRQPYWPFHTEHFWIGYPHSKLDGLSKLYYLLQAGFWLHQVLVLNLEAKRKDHVQMFTHHIITVALIVLSYVSSYTRIGNIILCLMDPSDILLATAKCLRYAGQQTLCDIGFGLFVASWIITRHVLYNIVVWSAFVESPRYISIGWSWEESYFFTDRFRYLMVGLLVALQIILLLWFAMIAKVAWRVVSGSGAHDSRSDDEDSDEDEEEEAEDARRAASKPEQSARGRINGSSGAAAAAAAKSSSVQATNGSIQKR